MIEGVKETEQKNVENTSNDIKSKIKNGNKLFYSAYKIWQEGDNKWNSLTDTIDMLFNDISKNMKKLKESTFDSKYHSYDFKAKCVQKETTLTQLENEELHKVFRSELVGAIEKFSNKFFDKEEEREDVNYYLFDKLGFQDPEQFIQKGPYQFSSGSLEFGFHTVLPSKLPKYPNFSKLYIELKEYKYSFKEEEEVNKN